MAVDLEDVEGIARRAYGSLPGMRAGSVLVIWADGSMTEEGFGFRRRRVDGRLVEPVASFPAKSSASFRELHRRLVLGFIRHGLLPPRHAGEFSDPTH